MANRRAQTIARLLEQNTSLAIVRDFLKEQGLHHSAGSWEALRTQRIFPYINEGKLGVDELERLLIATEEFGKQHVFLFKCSKKTAKECLDENRVKQILADQGLSKIFSSSALIENPAKITFSDVRFDAVKNIRCLTIKFVEVRWSTEYVGESVENNVITKTWRKISERAVSVVRLHEDGLLEFRVASHSTSSKYENELKTIWELVEPFFPRKIFSEVSLSGAKNKILDEKSALKAKIRFFAAGLENDYGNSLKVAGSTDTDLADDDGVSESVEKFREYDASCERINFYFTYNEKSGIPRRDIHVLIGGMMNEFAIPANCIRDDYEYVLEELRELNK